jgi:tRNA G18 (ribose-2'-O)-methylase SpoU
LKTHNISSSENSKYLVWKSLLVSKGIKEHGLCLVSGEKILHELDRAECILGVSHEELETYGSLTEAGFVLEPRLFKELDVMGTHHPIAVVKVPEFERQLGQSPMGLEVVVPLSDPTNLGAVIRSAVGFGANLLILTTESANPFLPKAVRASSGACFKVKYLKVNTVSDVNDGIGLDMAGPSLLEFQFPKDARIVVGEEGRGLSESFKGMRVRIPISNNTESLNATVAASLALYEYRRQHPIS